MDKLADHKFAGVTPALRADISHFYSNPSPVLVSSGKNVRRWNKTKQEVDDLRAATLAPAN
jgi:hypothetical protein